MKLKDNARAKFRFTDEGYLISEGVKLARTGPMEYLGSDLGKEANKIYDVYVNEDELFHPDTMKSFENVPITINHPEEMEVNARNWEELSKGTIINVRPSEDRKFLLGDAIVNSAKAIATIQDGTSEVSCGYDADIELIDGKLTKVNIRGNHLAVLDEGRCGSECKLNLNDGKPKEMTTKRTMLDKILGRKPKKATSVKFGDTKAKLTTRTKKLNDAKADFDKKLADAEEVVLSPDATTEEKAAAVQDLQAEAASLTEEAQGVLDDAQAATAQAEELASQIEQEVPPSVNDADTAEAAAELADLEAQLKEKDDKIAQLEEELQAMKDAEDNSATLGDAKASFPKVAFKDGMTAKEAKAAAVASTGHYTKDQAMKLTDCALNSAYAAAKTMQKKAPQVGKVFIGNDSKAKTNVPASLRSKGGK